MTPEALATITLGVAITTLLGTGGVLYSLGALRVEVEAMRKRLAGFSARLETLEGKAR